MARFRYSMENILRVKERIEEQKRMALGKAIVDFQEQVAIQRGIETKLQAYLDTFYGGQKRKVSAKDLKRMSGQVAYYKRSLKTQQDVVETARVNVQDKRLQLKTALEERKIQEKLKENAFEQYQDEVKQKEQQLLDEVVGNRYATNREG